MRNDRFVYILKRTYHVGLKVQILFSCVKNNILLAATFVKYCSYHSKIKFISIFAPPCDIFYIIFPKWYEILKYFFELTDILNIIGLMGYPVPINWINY